MKRSWLVLLGLFLFMGLAQATPLVGNHWKPKWTQLPDMDQGTDFLSMHRANGPIVADDFQSDGRDIWGFHWWGSYFEDAEQQNDPGFERILDFEISFHKDCPAGTPISQACPGDDAGNPYNYSTPAQPYQFTIVSVEEDYFGQTTGGEDVFEYWAALSTPWEEIAGDTYWVDFGWVAGQFGTDPTADIWGWHESSTHWQDFAVQTNPPSPRSNPHKGPWKVLTGHDMAFEVLTVPEPAGLGLLVIGLAGLGFAGRRGGRRS